MGIWRKINKSIKIVNNHVVRCTCLLNGSLYQKLKF